MMLAEMLLLRGGMQKKLTSLRERIALNAVVQEGDAVHEDPEGLITEAFAVLEQLERLVFRINQANMQNHIADGRSLTEAIAHRDTLIQQHSLIGAAIAGTQREPDRWSGREIKWVAMLDVAQLHRRADDLAVEIRQLNASIQHTNWQVELE
jgi:hypothetical protein